MAGFTNASEASILDALHTLFGTTLYLGLSTTTPTEAAGNFTEPSTGGYARLSVVAANWNAAVAGDPSTKSNSAVFTFATASGTWSAGANMTHFGLYNALTVGTLVAWGVLTTAKPVISGDIPTFPAGTIILQAGDPGDVY